MYRRSFTFGSIGHHCPRRMIIQSIDLCHTDPNDKLEVTFRMTNIPDTETTALRCRETYIDCIILEICDHCYT